MSLQRIIELQLNTGNTARTLKDIETQLAKIDRLVATGNKAPFNPLGGTGGATNPTKTATKTLNDYAGQLSNVQRAVSQSMGVQTRAERALLRYDTATRKINKSFKEGKLSQREYNQAVSLSQGAFEKATKEAKDYDRAMMDMQKQSGKTTGSFKAMRGGMANLNFQLQDVAVQAQMGTDLMIILGQQGPQIASIFGAGGAVVGSLIAFGSLLGGVVLSSLLNVGDAMETLQKNTENLDKTFSQSSNGVSTYSSELIELYRVSSELAELDLAISLVQLDSALSLVAKSTGQVLNGVGGIGGYFGFDTKDSVDALNNLRKAGIDLDTLFSGDSFVGSRGRSFALAESGGDLNKSISNVNTLKSNAEDLSDQFKITERQAVSLIDVVSKISEGGDSKEDYDAQADSLRNVIKSFGDLSSVKGKDTEKVAEARAELSEYLIQLQTIVSEGRKRVILKDFFDSKTALESFESLNSSLDDSAKYMADLRNGADSVYAAISEIAGVEGSINDSLLERLSMLDDEESIELARAQAIKVAGDARLQIIANLLSGLDTEEQKEQAILQLRERGLQVSEALVLKAKELSAIDLANMDLDTFGDNTEATISRLSKSLEVLESQSGSPEDTRLASAIRNIKDELIALGQESNFLEVVSDQLGQAIKFQGTDVALSFVEDMREAGSLTEDQYIALKKTVEDTEIGITRSTQDANFEIEKQIAAYSESQDAVDELAVSIKAAQDLGLAGINVLTDEQKIALDAYIVKLKELNRAEEDRNEITARNKKLTDQRMSAFKNIAGAAGSGLLTGDFSGAASALSGLLESEAESGITNALTSSLGAGAAGILGSFGAGLAGSVASGILAGKEEISRSVRIVFEDGMAQAFTDIKYGSIFGSSSSSSKFNSADNELVNNTINGVLNSLNKTFNEIGVTVDNFSGSFSGDTFSDAITDMTDQFINSGFDSIDAFRDLEQSTEDAFDDLISLIKTASESIRSAVGTGLDESIGQFIDSRASDIDSNANAAADYWSSYLRVIDDITNGATAPLEAGEQYINAFSVASTQLANDYGGSIARLRKDIAFIEQNQLKEALGRLGEGELVAYGEFAESLSDLVKDGDISGAFDALNSVISTETETYAEIINNARQDLEGLGFDASISAEQFAKKYDDALSNAIDTETLANFLNAAILLNTIDENTESLNDELEDAADSLATLQIRLASAMGDDDLALRLTREQELASASSDAARAILSQIYAAEDAETAFDSAADALNRLATAQMSSTDNALAVLEKSIDAQKDLLKEAYDAEVEAIEKATKDFSSVISALESLSSSLESALKASQIDSFALNYSRLQLARSVISSTVASGVVPTDGSLDSAISSVTGDNKQFYSDFNSYATDQAKQNNDLLALKKLTDSQLETTKSAEQIAEEQLDTLEKTYEDSINALDNQLEAAQEQVDILRNIDITAIGIELALSKLADAIGVESQGTSGFSSQEIGDTARSIFGSITSSGGTEDDAYRAIGTRAINEGVSSAELAMALGVPQDTVLDIADRLGLPAFAKGGNHYGGSMLLGENGPEIVNVGPSRVFSASQTSQMLSGGSNSEVIDALAYTNQLLYDLNVKMIDSNDNTDLLQNWNNNGLDVNVISDVTA